MEIKQGADQNLNPGLETSNLFDFRVDVGTKLSDIHKARGMGLGTSHALKECLLLFLSIPHSPQRPSQTSTFPLKPQKKIKITGYECLPIYHSLMQPIYDSGHYHPSSPVPAGLCPIAVSSIFMLSSKSLPSALCVD